MYDTLLKVTEDTRIWEGQRRATHAFHLSPSVYRITTAQQQELTQLGYAITDCLQGLSHLATIAFDRELNYRGVWTELRQIFSSGVPKAYHDLQGQNRTQLPQLLKVDLMVNEWGEFRIAEIDGHNKHGLGYATLGRLFRQSLYPEAKALPGAVKLITDYVRKLGFDTVKIFYADQERFYLPEFEIAQAEFAKLGLHCQVFSEMEAETALLKEGLFLDLPFLYHRTALYETIIDSYKKARSSSSSLPNPFSGPKECWRYFETTVRIPSLRGYCSRSSVPTHSNASGSTSQRRTSSERKLSRGKTFHEKLPCRATTWCGMSSVST